MAARTPQPPKRPGSACRRRSSASRPRPRRGGYTLERNRGVATPRLQRQLLRVFAPPPFSFVHGDTAPCRQVGNCGCPFWVVADEKAGATGLISTSPHFGVCVSLLPWSSRGPVPAGRTRRAGERRGGACVPERCFTSSQSLPLTCKVVLIRSRLAAAAAAPDSQQATAPGGGTTLSHAAQPPEWCPPVRSAAAQDGVVVAIVDGVGVCVVARGSSRHAAGGENRRVRPARNGGRTRRR